MDNIENAIEMLVDLIKDLHPELNRELENCICPECKIEFNDIFSRHEEWCKIGRVEKILREIDR